MTTTEPEHHPLSDLFPLMRGAELDELREDIKQHGIHEPILLFEGKVLDGRNRLRCAMDLGINFPVRLFDGEDPTALVISLNLKRRHLTESQRASVAARLAKTRHGGDRRSDQAANLQVDPSQAEAAEMLKVSERSVASARKVHEDGADELIQALDDGVVAVSTAADVATLPKAAQVIVCARGVGEILKVAKQVRAERAVGSRQGRLERISEISKGNRELGIERTYPIIYADPPWRYENPAMGDSDRSIENHYPTMSLEEICAMPVEQIATKDAILYLWATAPKLAECMQVITAWGFTYRTCAVWDKQKIGMGYYFRNQHELLLLARRGDFPIPTPGTQPASVYREPRGAHSAKPAYFAEMIEQAYPTLAKIELFGRAQRPGWTVWGNQSETDNEMVKVT